MPNIKLILVLSAIVLAGCGGGGGGSNSASSSSSSSNSSSSAASSDSSASSSSIAAGTELTGRFLDSAIEGLEYESASYSGKTDAKGEFKYAAGEEITFKLYGATITTVKNPVNGIVTPADLAAMQVNKVLAILQLVQSLDEDGDPTNGIKVPAFDYAKYADVTNDHRLLSAACRAAYPDDHAGLEAPDLTTGTGYRCNILARNAEGKIYYDDNGELAEEIVDFPDKELLKAYYWSAMTWYLNDYDATKAALSIDEFGWYSSLPQYLDYLGRIMDDGENGWWFVKAFHPTRDIVTAENAVAHFSDTIGAISASTDVVLSLPGKVGTVNIERNYCKEPQNTYAVTYVFNETGWSYAGRGLKSLRWASGTYDPNMRTDGLTPQVRFWCTRGDISGTTNYSGRSDKNYLPCADGQCKYADVNRMEFVDGADGSRYLLFTWYNDTEKTYHHIQKYLKPTLVEGHLALAHKTTTIKFDK